MDYFTSDTHYSHTNIIKYCNRPFSDVSEMNKVLVENINKVVKPTDTLYHLGDWSFGGRDNAKIFRDKIKCDNVILIWGNHDHPEHKHLFKSTYDIFTYRGPNKIRIVLCHYALKVWDKSHHGVMHLYGHSHGSLPDNPHSLSFDIGVDCHNYKPLSLDEVVEIMSKKTWKPVDHHNKSTT